MEKMLLIGALVVAASLLNGCMIISYQDRGALRRPCVIGGPSGRVGIVFLPREIGPEANASPRIVPSYLGTAYSIPDRNR